MNNVNRWGLAAGLAAALALFGNAQAQGAASSSGSGTSGSGSRGDTGGPTPSGADRSSASGSSTPSGGAPGTSSDSGERSGASGTSTGAGSSATGGTGSAASGAQAKKLDKGLQDKLEKIHAAHQTELQLARVATQNAQSPEVKQFAEQMQNDHQRADEKLTQTAQSMGVSLEGKTFQKESDRAKKDMEKLQSKTGTDFDKEYMSRMVKEHERAEKDTSSAAKDARKANQTELAALLEQGHTGIQGHLQHAKDIQKAVDQGGRPAAGGTGSSGSMGREPGAQPGSGSRGDTGGPTPGGADRSTGSGSTTPGGGAPGTSSDPGQRPSK
jgi:putative membrane protein